MDDERTGPREAVLFMPNVQSMKIIFDQNWVVQSLIYTGLEEAVGSLRFICLELEWERFRRGPIPTRIS